MANERWHLLVPELVLQMLYSAVFLNCVSVTCRSSFHKNWHQTQCKLNLQYCMKFFRFKDKCGKNINTWKIRPLMLPLRSCQIHKQILLYSWKTALCGFVAWNWNLEVCFSSAVTLTPNSQVPPNSLCIFTEFQGKKKKGRKKTLAF